MPPLQGENRKWKVKNGFRSGPQGSERDIVPEREFRSAIPGALQRGKEKTVKRGGETYIQLL